MSYMPYLKNGGIFIKTARNYEMGQSLALNITLPDALESETVSGKVVWLTPNGTQSSTPPGIGIGFIDDKSNLRDQIEKVLGSMLNTGEPTYTM